MIKLARSRYYITVGTSFPVYWKATDTQLEQALYDSDAWGDDTENYFYILSFNDIKQDFDSWSDSERKEYLGDDCPTDYTVYDWIRDCMMNSLAVISGFHEIERSTTMNIKTYPIGNGEITLSESDAEELRVILQSEHYEKKINEIIDKNPDCFAFTSEYSRSHFVHMLVDASEDDINVEDCFYENLEEAVFTYADNLGISR